MTAQRVRAVRRTEEAGSEPDEVQALADRLDPRTNRRAILARLDGLFRAGPAPEPLPEGFLPGRLLTTSVWPALDFAVLRVARAWMPWQGKSFDPGAGTGVNRFANTAGNRAALKALFPRYVPERIGAEAIEAFPFETRVAPGELDPGVAVLKIDYDFEPNPRLIRRVLDELVEVAPGRYLGKVLLRYRGAFRPVGFFSLRLDAGETVRSG